MILEIKNLSFAYKDGEKIKQLFDDVSLSFENGRFYCITGPSGSGKTTLLSLIGTIENIQNGQILLDGKNIFDDPASYRKDKVGFVFQNYNLINYMSAVENVALAMEIAGRKADMHQIIGTLDLLGIDKETAQKKVTKLSGGEQQRVSIARAFINNPNLILADEATGNLDGETSDVIVNILILLAHKFNKCIIMVTHNQEIALQADIEYRIENKKISMIKH